MAQPTLSTSNGVPDTIFYRLSQFGIQYVEIAEQHPAYFYPTPDVVHEPGYYHAEAAGAATGDFNGDGLQDLVVNWALFPHTLERSSSIQPSILLNDGQGGLGAPNANVVGELVNVHMRYRPVVADLNGDGRDDVVFAGSGKIARALDGSEVVERDPITIILSQSDGTMRDATNHIAGQEVPGGVPDGYGFGHDMAVGDVDGDGDVDLFSARVLLLNDGQAHFSNASDLLAPEALKYDWILTASVIGDFDHNGREDLVVAYAEGPVFLLSATAGPQLGWDVTQLPPGLFGSVTSYNSAAAADINHDGHLDIVFGQTRADPYYQGRSVQVLINDGAGRFEDQTSERINNSHRENTHWGEGNVHIVDVDHDGDLDIYDSSVVAGDFQTSGSAGAGTAVALNDGSGRFTWVDMSAFVQVQPTNLAGHENDTWLKVDPIGTSFPIDLDGQGGLDYVGNIVSPFTYPQTAPSGVTLFSALSVRPLGRGIDEFLGGLATDDDIAGFDGNDVITGAAGSDIIDGGSGIDTSVYDGARSEYGVILRGEGPVEISRLGSIETDVLTNVEVLQFTDGSLRLDLDDNAGGAYRIYQAAFGRAPDNGGLKYWIERIDAGTSLHDVARSFVTSDEFQKTYGGDPANELLVDLLYHNVLGRDGEPEGFTFWVEELNSGRRDTAAVLMEFSESAENVARVFPAISDGIWYT